MLGGGRMNRAQFKTAHHEFRAANSAYGYKHGIATARNSHDFHREQSMRLTGWNWRIAQQYGEGMATRLTNMFTWARQPARSTLSQRLRNRYDWYWTKLGRQATLNVAMARINELFHPTASTSTVNPLCSNTNGAVEVVDLIEVCSIFGDAS